MSEMRVSNFADSDDDPRPLWRAALANLIVSATLLLIPTIVLRAALVVHSEEVREVGAAPILRPEIWSAGWVAELAPAFVWALICVLPGTLLFLILIRWLERRRRATTLIWTLAGSLSALPLAAGLCVLLVNFSHVPPHFIEYAIAAGIPCTIGFCAGGLAWHFRHRRRPDWSEAL